MTIARALIVLNRAALCVAINCAVVCTAQTPLTYTISTVAGTGTAGYTGDGGAGGSAELNGCSAVTADSAGNLYIADSGNNVIRKLAKNGIITTVAGNGTAGYTGDGAAATASELNTPQGVALDSAGNLYIADSGNNVIRKVTLSTGLIATVAGDGTLGYLGDGAAATSAYLQTPGAVYVDTTGNILIADTGNNVVREVNTAGIISTIAGDSAGTTLGDGGAATSATLYNPEGLAEDSSGNIYISDGGHERIRLVNTSGIISTIAGIPFPGYSGDGGPAVTAELNGPKGIALDGSGDLFIADYFNSSIRMVAPNGVITTVAGNAATQGFSGDGGPATAAQLNFPSGVAVGPGGILYIADYYNNRIRMLTPALPAPTVGTGGVINASGFGGSSSIAPGSWIEIYGVNLSADTRSFTTSDFTGVNAPMSLDGTSVTIGGQSAYVAFISPGHVNAQVPSTVATGTQPVIVTTYGGSSPAVTVNVNEAQPGLLATPLFDVAGTQYVAAILPDFVTYIAPPGSIAGITSRQAKPGETIVIYGIGFGPVTPAIPAGQTVTQTNNLTLPLQVFFGTTQASLTYSGLAPGAIGLYQLNVIVPTIPDSDAVPLTFKLNGVAGTQTLFTAVKSD